MSFELDSIGAIREDDEYGGFRAAIISRYESITTPLKIDFTTGDVITPATIQYSFPLVFEDRSLKILAYNPETVLAEKIETILRRGVLNTRPRDFYDVYIIAKTKGVVISKQTLIMAIGATSKKRGSLDLLKTRDSVLADISNDSVMNARWERYATENFYAKEITFGDTVQAVKELLS